MTTNKDTRGRKLKFPVPADYKSSEPAIICPAERVIGLYNQDSGSTGQRISKKVRRWFSSQAHSKDWAGVHFLKEVQSNHGAGCVLWRPPHKIDVSITVTQRTLVLSAEDESAEDESAEDESAEDE